ncbi:MAG TPA: hypothetical protein VL400_14655, partial [Polyangiaceae bacterium]|nr:hypothetical protein [Polyangiaceae bacterium]
IGGGILVGRRGLENVIRPIAIVQSGAILLYVALAAIPMPLAAVTAIVAVEQLVAGFGTAAFTVFILRLASGPYKATHFALGTALMSFGMLVSSVSGFVLNAVGFTKFFVFAFGASLPGVAIAMLLPRTIRAWARASERSTVG